MRAAEREIMPAFGEAYAEEKKESADKDVDKSPPAQETWEDRTLKLSKDGYTPACIRVYPEDKEEKADRSARPEREIEYAAES